MLVADFSNEKIRDKGCFMNGSCENLSTWRPGSRRPCRETGSRSYRLAIPVAILTLALIVVLQHLWLV